MTKRYSKRENMARLGQTREVYMIIDIKSSGSPLGRTRFRCEDNINMYPEEMSLGSTGSRHDQMEGASKSSIS